jgi:hypothetical protein
MAEFTLIGLIDLVGVIAFIIAGVLAVKHYQHTRTISDYWLFFAASAFLAAVWSGAVTLEKFGIYPDVIDMAVPPLFTAVATAFALTALYTSVSIAHPR